MMQLTWSEAWALLGRLWKDHYNATLGGIYLTRPERPLHCDILRGLYQSITFLLQTGCISYNQAEDMSREIHNYRRAKGIYTAFIWSRDAEGAMRRSEFCQSFAPLSDAVGSRYRSIIELTEKQAWIYLCDCWFRADDDGRVHIDKGRKSLGICGSVTALHLADRITHTCHTSMTYKIKKHRPPDMIERPFFYYWPHNADGNIYRGNFCHQRFLETPS